MFLAEAQAVAAYDALTSCGGVAGRVGNTQLENTVSAVTAHLDVPLAEALNTTVDVSDHAGELPAIADVITLPGKELWGRLVGELAGGKLAGVLAE